MGMALPSRLPVLLFKFKLKPNLNPFPLPPPLNLIRLFLLHSSSSSSAHPVTFISDGLRRRFGSVSLEFGGTRWYKGAQKDAWIISLASFAVSAHNLHHGKALEFVRVVGASHTSLSSLLYHVTLEARPSSGKPQIYHAVLWLQLCKNVMELLAWNPVDDRFSVLGIKAGDMKLHEAVMNYMSQNETRSNSWLNV